MQRSVRLSSILFVLVLLVSGSMHVWSAQAIRVPASITMVAGQRLRIPVTGTLDAGGTVRISLEYPAHLVRIVGVIGGSTAAFRCQPPFTSRNEITDARTATLGIDCWDIAAVTEGLVVEIDVEVLAGTADTGTLTVTGFERNGQSVTDASLTSGLLRREGAGPLPLPSPEEGIVMVTPNPMITDALVRFVAHNAHTVRILIRDARGGLVKEFDGIQAAPGMNEALLHTEMYEMANGAYVLELITETGDWYYPIVVVR